MARMEKVANLRVGALYRRTKDRRTIWIRVDAKQHATAVYDSIAEKWEMGVVARTSVCPRRL